MTITTESAATAAIDKLPREHLTFLPTPLERLTALSSKLGIDLWMKRDDQTSLALGGNKARKLEFLIGEALAKGSDLIITTGGSQSNHARITAAACRKVGLECLLVLDKGRHPENGNLLLDHLFGANIELLDDPDPSVAAARMVELRDQYASKGRRPYVIPRGGSIPQGSVGYTNMVGELAIQLEETGLEPDVVYVASGSCGTHAGVMSGRAAFEQTWKVQGISVSRPGDFQEQKVRALANETLEWLKLSTRVVAEDCHVDDRFVGDGYGVPTASMWHALRELAMEEAIVLDPVYTGKAMAGLLSHIREEKVRPGETVIFVHSGGAPGLFGYARELEKVLGSD